MGLPAGPAKPIYALVGYPLRQTLSDHGTVNRGVCRTDSAGRLSGIDEVLKIERTSDGRARAPLPWGGWRELTGDEPVSMTCFGFSPEFRGSCAAGSVSFWTVTAKADAEFYLPVAVGDLLQAGYADVRVLRSEDEWFGMTYREDVPSARAALRRLIDRGCTRSASRLESGPAGRGRPPRH